MDKVVACAVPAAVVASIGIISYASVVSSKDHKAVKKMEALMDKAMNEAVIPEDMITKAVDKAVETKLRDFSLDACRKVIGDEVRASVAKAYDETKGSVKSRLESSVQDIDIQKVIREVQDKSVDETMKRLTKEMDNITSEYRRRLRNLSPNGSGFTINF